MNLKEILKETIKGSALANCTLEAAATGSYIFYFLNTAPLLITVNEGSQEANAQKLEKEYNEKASSPESALYCYYTRHTSPEAAETWLIKKARRSKDLFNIFLEFYAENNFISYCEKVEQASPATFEDYKKLFPVKDLLKGLLYIPVQSYTGNIPQREENAIRYYQLAIETEQANKPIITINEAIGSTGKGTFDKFEELEALEKGTYTFYFHGRSPKAFILTCSPETNYKNVITSLYFSGLLEKITGCTYSKAQTKQNNNVNYSMF